MLEGTGGGQEIMVGQYLFQHSNLFEVLIWDAGGIAFEMQRPTIAMDIKTNDHKSIISWQIFIAIHSTLMIARDAQSKKFAIQSLCFETSKGQKDSGPEEFTS